jgi:hypothetical protein
MAEPVTRRKTYRPAQRIVRACIVKDVSIMDAVHSCRKNPNPDFHLRTWRDLESTSPSSYINRRQTPSMIESHPQLHSIYHHQISSNAISLNSGIDIGRTGYIEEAPSRPASISQLFSVRTPSRETNVCLTGMLLQWPSHEGESASLRTALVIRSLSLPPDTLTGGRGARYRSVTDLAEAQSARFAGFVDAITEKVTLHRAAELFKGQEDFVARRDHSQGTPDWLDKEVGRIVSVLGATVCTA